MNKGKKQFLQKYSHYIDVKKRKTSSIKVNRLKNDTFGSSERELIALNFLLKRRSSANLLHDLHCILAMKSDMSELFLPRKVTPLEKEWGKKFREQQEIIDAVLQTLFQWFGTNVGYAELEKLLEIMKEWNKVADIDESRKRDTRMQVLKEQFSTLSKS